MTPCLFQHQAGCGWTSMPTLLIFVLLGRYFVRGLPAGSLKG